MAKYYKIYDNGDMEQIQPVNEDAPRNYELTQANDIKRIANALEEIAELLKSRSQSES